VNLTPLLIAAFIAGFIDAIAGGGGLISLPALLGVGQPLGLGLAPHLALGTNKGHAFFGAATSAVSFWKRGFVDRDRAALGFVSGFIGSLLGAALQLWVPSKPLKPVITILLSVCVVLTFIPRRRANASEMATRTPIAVLGLLGFICGCYDGFFGPGTGTFLVIGFTWLFGDSLARASGNAKVVNLASNLAATLVFAFRGTILWKLSLPMALANATGALLGARATAYVGDALVKWALRFVGLALIVKLILSMR
jgi:uncharacterized protein